MRNGDALLQRQHDGSYLAHERVRIAAWSVLKGGPAVGKTRLHRAFSRRAGQRRRACGPVTELVLLTAVIVGVAAGASGAEGVRPWRPVARAGRVITVSDKSELHLVRAVGETLIEEGKATGTLAGKAKIRLNIDAAQGTATARFTLYTHGGTLSGHSSGSASGGHGGWESFSGTMRLDHGTGRYLHGSGTGRMYGAIYRRTDRLIVQYSGRLHY